MKAKFPREKLTICVEWDTFGEEKDDKKAQDLYQMSARDYLERFNSLPPIGMHLANGYCDAGKIVQIDYDGCNDRVMIWLDF